MTTRVLFPGLRHLNPISGLLTLIHQCSDPAHFRITDTYTPMLRSCTLKQQCSGFAIKHQRFEPYTLSAICSDPAHLSNNAQVSPLSTKGSNPIHLAPYAQTLHTYAQNAKIFRTQVHKTNHNLSGSIVLFTHSSSVAHITPVKYHSPNPATQIQCLFLAVQVQLPKLNSLKPYCTDSAYLWRIALIQHSNSITIRAIYRSY